MKANQHTLFIILLSCGLLLQAPTAAQAWDDCGHKTVAAIAFSQLSPKAKKKVNAIFKKDLRHRQFIDAAVWPDDLKQNRRNDLPVKAPLDKPWHYVDIPFDATPSEIEDEINNHGKTVNPAHEKSANVVTAIRFYTDFLKTNKLDATTKADALSWLIHLVGDIHQPLHCANVVHALPNYTPPSDDGGDLGGNGFIVRHPAHKLHSLWDDLFDEPTGDRDDDGRDGSDANARNIASDLSARVHPDATLLTKPEPADWARESYALREFAYSPELAPNANLDHPRHTITDAYLNQAGAKAEERVILAGTRLAKLIESIYGH